VDFVDFVDIDILAGFIYDPSTCC